MNDTKNDTNNGTNNGTTHINMYNWLKLRELYMKRSTWIRDFAAPKNNINIVPKKNNYNQFYGAAAGSAAACSGSLKNK